MSSPNSPLLRSNNNTEQTSHRRSLSLRRRSLHQAIRVLQRTGTRNGLMMREPSDQIDNNDQSENNWAYSKPVVILDLVWNFVYIIVAILVLVLSRKENPEMPLRVWIVGYCLISVLHVVCFLVEYRRRGYRQSPFPEETFGGDGSGSSSDYVTLAELTPVRTSSVAKYMDSANTTLSFFWWIIGFYWVWTGGQQMVEESPQLYWYTWKHFFVLPDCSTFIFVFLKSMLSSLITLSERRLCIVFLAFDVIFVGVCILFACVVGLGVCCCLPCIIAVAITLNEQKGAKKEDIEQLPTYIFRCNGGDGNSTGEIQGKFTGVMSQCGTATSTEHSLSIDAADCSICLSTYNDGDELRELPCDHHFHCTCIDKWLYMSATCPLCKRCIKDNCCTGEV